MNTKFSSKALLLVAITTSGNLFSSSNFVVNDTRYDVRYITNNKRLPDNRYQAELRENSPWKNFALTHPAWTVLFNEENKMPAMAYGEAIPVAGITAADRAMNFINTYLLDYKIPLADISVKSVTANAGEFDYVNFIQTYKGLKVLDSRLMIKMTKAGEVLYFKADVFNDINISVSPFLPEGEAINIAKSGFAESITNFYAEPGVKILPVPQYRRYEYHLVYEIVVETKDEINNVPAKYYTLVDAHSGKILYRKNKVDHFAPLPIVTVNGTVYPTNPYGNPLTQVVGLPHLKIVSGGTTYTDAQGIASNVNSGNATLTLEGLYCQTMTGTTVPSMTANISGNTTLSFDADANVRERSAYYHLNIVHDFMKALPQLSSFTTEDFPFETYVDVPGSCNAFYNGNVNLYAAGGGCNAMALVSDVIYHEYGHGLNYDIYSYYGQNFSNGAMGEGYSDVWGMAITNVGKIGVGFYTSNQDPIRDYVPPSRKVYPQDLVGEVHADGEIIAGAWWEVNLNMGNNLAFMTDLFIKTFPAGPNGPDGAEGQVFTDVLIAALQADDVPSNGGDNNICNGTPNSAAVQSAFAAHGITLYTNITLNHTPVTAATPLAPITITATATASGGPCTLTGGNLFWRTANTQPWNQTAMSYSNPTLTGAIPGQPSGTIVQYYIEVGGNVMPTGANLTNIPYYILVDFTPNTSLYSDLGDAQDFGTWNMLSAGNSTGTWIIDIPVPSYINSNIVQTGTQVTPAGSYCAVTANAPSSTSSAGTADVDGGATLLESPTFDLTGFLNPAITYERWYSNSQGASPGNDPWVTQLSNDNGTNWTDVEFTYTPDVSWRRFAFKVLDYLPLSSQMMMRFIASDSATNGQSLVEAALDEFQVWDGPLVGVEDESTLFLGISIFPNPTGGKFVVQITNQYRFTDYELEIYNVYGEKVYSSIIHQPSSIIHLKAPSGIYFLHLKTAEGTVTRKVTVVR